MACLLLALGLVSGAFDEANVDLARVPAPARRAAQRAVPGLKLTEATVEQVEGQTVYTLSGEDAQERDVEVEVTARGVVLSVSLEIELARVPSVVKAALRAKVRGFRPTAAMEVHEGGRLTSYSFEGKDADGDEIEVTVSSDGSKVEVDDD